jgi:hypothetical protein
MAAPAVNELRARVLGSYRTVLRTVDAASAAGQLSSRMKKLAFGTPR